MEKTLNAEGAKEERAKDAKKKNLCALCVSFLRALCVEGASSFPDTQLKIALVDRSRSSFDCILGSLCLLLSFGRSDLQFERLAYGAHHLDFVLLSGFHLSERISVIMYIADLVPGHPDDPVARF